MEVDVRLPNLLARLVSIHDRHRKVENDKADRGCMQRIGVRVCPMTAAVRDGLLEPRAIESAYLAEVRLHLGQCLVTIARLTVHSVRPGSLLDKKVEERE